MVRVVLSQLFKQIQKRKQVEWFVSFITKYKIAVALELNQVEDNYHGKMTEFYKDYTHWVLEVITHYRPIDIVEKLIHDLFSELVKDDTITIELVEIDLSRKYDLDLVHELIEDLKFYKILYPMKKNNILMYIIPSNLRNHIFLKLKIEDLFRSHYQEPDFDGLKHDVLFVSNVPKHLKDQFIEIINRTENASSEKQTQDNMVEVRRLLEGLVEITLSKLGKKHTVDLKLDKMIDLLLDNLKSNSPRAQILLKFTFHVAKSLNVICSDAAHHSPRYAHNYTDGFNFIFLCYILVENTDYLLEEISK